MPSDASREHQLGMIWALLAAIGGLALAFGLLVHLLVDGHHGGPGLSVPYTTLRLDAVARVEVLMGLGAMLVSAFGWWRVQRLARVQEFERAWALHRADG